MEQQCSVSQAIKILGNVISPDVMRESIAIFGRLQLAPSTELSISRDLVYGTNERHVLDVFAPNRKEGLQPVILFVHGGGFVAGSKREGTSAFYDNVGAWAATNGFVGVTMNYRLAPMHKWPAGSEDVASALRWLKENIASLGGNPEHIILMGHSAGAVHAAGYIASNLVEPDELSAIVGCVLLSGFYDNQTIRPNAAYFGEDELQFAKQSTLRGLTVSDTPLFLVMGEYDPPMIHSQNLSVLNAKIEQGKKLPYFVNLVGHNHFSPVFQLNTAADGLGGQLIAFINSCCRHERTP